MIYWDILMEETKMVENVSEVGAKSLQKLYSSTPEIRISASSAT